MYATGQNTYFGKTAQLVQEAHTVSHFQQAVLKIGNYLIILAVLVFLVVVANFGRLWLTAYSAGARVSWRELVGMWLRQRKLSAEIARLEEELKKAAAE